MPMDRLQETLLALRKFARQQPNGTYTFAHNSTYRAAFVRGILLRRKLIRELQADLDYIAMWG